MRILRIATFLSLQIVMAGTPSQARAPDGPERIGCADPLSAVWSMLDAFGRRSAAEYVLPMTDDFVFQSDDEDFARTWPNGMTREDERAFATHLFEGGGRGPDGEPLPTAARVDIATGPIAIECVTNDRIQARVVLHHLQARIVLTDSLTIDLGDTRNQLDLVQTEAGWRLRAWTETHTTAAERDSIDERLRQAIEWRQENTRLATPRRENALSLVPHVDRRRAAILFEVVLPHAGGRLEMFDVAGRRLARRDLGAMSAGRHQIALDGGDYRAGVYFARLTQDDAAVRTSLVLLH